MIAYVLIKCNDCAKRVKFSANTVVLRPLVKNNHRFERWNNNSSDKRNFTMTLICNRFKFNRFFEFFVIERFVFGKNGFFFLMFVIIVVMFLSPFPPIYLIDLSLIISLDI